MALGLVCHPLWWAALTLLLVNGNVLNGRGLVPGWVTGKGASDALVDRAALAGRDADVDGQASDGTP